MFDFMTFFRRWYKIENNSNITEIIINTINTIFSNLFSSIDNNAYSLLDNLTFINTDILNNSFFEKLFNSNINNSIIIIANSLLVGFIIYYCFKLLFSNLYYIELERPYQFIFKLIIIGICINCSYFICTQIISINNLISSSIQELGKNIFNKNMDFNNLIIELNSIIGVEEESFNIFSLDGIIKGFISIGLFNLIFSYSLRYILIKVFILLFPFSFLTLINNSTSWFFKTYIRSFLGLLLLQSLVAIIFLIIFSIDYNSGNLLSKLLYIGGVYCLIKANSYIKELIGGISTEFSSYFSNLKNISFK